ncbi:type VI secretion system baseplate subunit TssF [Marinobacterium arenosum]|uniref:type VI secretion system baseplate subunit TssF n=1 Tax=Marinobacterium arenosum TaxID=2862496 RepID=UPI001C94FF1E|nr:type VI secretion system baseplate subunit TssF [Marinobacterium arenosum]MBY4677080.1 type VI secretion system baseplate subunit TssF [Marinobacterium arenosum]
MSDQLMRYYERELAYVRKAMAGFAARFPEQAAQLQINQNSIEDPNITRLIDGMALLTAKTEQRLDAQLPEIVQGLLSILYPGYTELAPSYSALTLEPDPEQLNENVCLPAGSRVAVPLPGGGECQFSTRAELNIYPFTLTAVSAEAAPFNFNVPGQLNNAEAVIQLSLACCDPEGLFSQLQVGDFDFYVRGFEQNAASLIELLLTRTEAISLSDREGLNHRLVDAGRMRSRLADPGFQWLPRYGNQFEGFDLLRDYFTYPDKGAYFRIDGLGEELRRFDENEVVLNLFVRQLPAEFLRLFDASVFRLNTVPAINLFEQQGEPLNYDFSRLSVPVVADAYADSNLEVVSVAEVREVLPDGERRLRPLYEARYRQPDEVRQWQVRQRWDEIGQRRVELTLSSQEDELQQAGSIVLALDLWCSNGRSPCTLSAGSEVESLAAIDLPGPLKLLTAPTAPLYPALDNSLNWRFIALLNANFSSLLQTDRPVQALQEVLTLCSHGRTCRQAEAIRDVRYEQQVAAMHVCGANIFATGTEVTLTLDAESLGSQQALFSEVMNAFFQQFCSFDRFMRLHVRHFGDDTNVRSFKPVHGSQLCL